MQSKVERSFVHCCIWGKYTPFEGWLQESAEQQPMMKSVVHMESGSFAGAQSAAREQIAAPSSRQTSMLSRGTSAGPQPAQPATASTASTRRANFTPEA